ncbi:TPA: cell wall-binding repeat-containing protein [Clostridioides difficile]|nr:cell wall-binding repeat-containing protein [Clostridioides difficile]HBF4443156.1 cell wall-binding repeat-containing protein [Clostridioides difficile]HBG1420690.1 cell wall-binding repeat-containing protein [Clostridioides difficile]
MKISKRLLALGMSVMIFVVSSSNVFALSSIGKIQGKDKYETAALIADKQSYTTAIIINSDDTLADGLSASGLAGVENAPILLTKKNSIPSSTLERLNKVKKVYIIGGKSSIGEEVDKVLKEKNIEIHRISGEDRIKTSYNVAKEINNKIKVEKIMLTNAYKGEPDAMSISQVAVREKSPIILTNGESVPFDPNGIKCFAIGGLSSISNSLIKSTKATRIGGIDRYDTNSEVIKYFYNTSKEFYITSGVDLVYSLVGSTISKNIPIVLTDSGSDKSILKDANKVTLIGSLGEKVIKEVINAVNGKSNEPDSGKEVVDVPGFGPQNPTESHGEDGNSDGDPDKIVANM